MLSTVDQCSSRPPSLASLCLSSLFTTFNIFSVPSPGRAPTLAVPCFQDTCLYSLICLTSFPGIHQEPSPLVVGYLWALTVLQSLPLPTTRPQHPRPHLLALGPDTTPGVPDCGEGGSTTCFFGNVLRAGKRRLLGGKVCWTTGHGSVKGSQGVSRRALHTPGWLLKAHSNFPTQSEARTGAHS